jgi:hypothetical protein
MLSFDDCAPKREARDGKRLLGRKDSSMIDRGNVEQAFEALAAFVDDNNPEHNDLAVARDDFARDLRLPEDPWVCGECGSTAILESVYLSANTGEVSSDFDPATDPICPDCHAAGRGFGGGMACRSEFESEDPPGRSR